MTSDKINSILFLYESYIEKCNRTFGKDSVWWCMLFSSKERFGSSVQENIINFYTNKINQKNHFIFIFSDMISKIKNFLKSILKIMRDLFYLIYFISINKFKKVHDIKAEIIFIRPIHNLPLNIVNNKVWDHYFGELPNKYIKLNKNISITGPIEKNIDLKSYIEKIEYNYFNILIYVKYINLLISFLKIFKAISVFYKLPLPKNETEIIVYNTIKKEIIKNLYSIFWFSIYESSFENYLKTQNTSIIFITYENNSWERAFIKAARQSNKVKKINGFLHCAILDSHLKYSLFKGEWELKYSPDKLIVTGPEPQRLLLRRGYTNKLLINGFDLRGPSLDKLKINKNKPRFIKKILILLEGLESMANFLLFLIESLKEESYILKVRCHPVLTIDKKCFSIVRDHEYFEKLEISFNKKLEDDFIDCDIAIYIGSTSALYAAYSGLPLLRMDTNWWVSEDPLHNCNYFKKEFKNKDSLLDGIRFFEDLDFISFNNHKQKIKDYLENYIRPYKNKDLDTFAKSLLND